MTLSDASVSRPSFTADTLAAGAADVTHVFTLTVTDNVGETDTDTVKVTVRPPLDTTRLTGRFWSIPESHDGATPIRMAVDFSREVRGFTASDLMADADPAGGDISQTGPVIANFRKDPGNALRYTFTVTPRASVWFSLTIDGDSFEDFSGNPGHDFSTGQISYVNTPPVADAGPDRTVVPGVVILDGSGSTDNNGTVETYRWMRTSGTGDNGVTLTGADTARPSFTAETLTAGDADVTHVFSLVVTDNESAASAADLVTVTVTASHADTRGPAAVFVEPVQETHDGMSPFELEVEFNEPVVGFTPEDIILALARQTGETDTGVSPPIISNFRQISNLQQARNVQTNYKFTLTPRGPVTFTVKLNEGSALDPVPPFQDLAGNGPSLSFAQTYVIRFNDANIWPIADAGPDQTVRSGVEVTLDGGMSRDDDGQIGLYTWTRTGGSGNPGVVLTKGNDNMGGNLNAESARARFTADTVAPGADDVTHIFDLVVTDNLGAMSVADTVKVTVRPPNVAPDADAGDDVTVAAGTEVTLDGSDSADIDGVIASWAWERTSGSGGAVTLTGANTARPSFTADTLGSGAADVTHVFSLVVTDNENAESVADTVTVTVTPNAPPEAHAGTNQTVVSEASVTLDGSGSTAATGRTIASYFWDRTGGTAGGSVELSDARVSKPTFTADLLVAEAQDVRHEFTLTVTDNVGETDTATVMVTVTSPFATPVAHAGQAQKVASGVTVTLDGRASTKDRRRTIASYLWKRTGGSGGAVELSSTSVVQPTFTADTLGSGASDVTHDFSLVVTDSAGVASVAATVTVTVTPNAPPEAHAGTNQTVVSEASVTLDGSGSTAATGRTIASYFWDRTGGTAGGSVELSDARVSKPTFTADLLVAEAQDVRHEFTLTVTDDVGETDTATVMVTVTSPFATPVAHAGEAQKVASGVTVTLDGRASTKDRRRTIASYLWKRTGGSGGSVELSSTSVVQPTFTADTLGSGASDVTHDFSLVVTDSAGVASVAATVTVTVTPNAPPEAHAGTNQTVVSEASVTLDGSGSTAATGRTIASYFWDRTGGTAGGSVELSDARVSKPTFTADLLVAEAQDVRHEFTLTVTDDVGESDTATVMVTVTSPFATPVAHAGQAQRVASGVTVTLDGRASTKDRRRTIASYLWKRTGGSGGAVELSSTSVVQPTFTADTLGSGASDVTHDFSLVVTDSAGVASVAATVTVTVTPNAPPEAHAGTNQTVVSEASVTLDGSGSTAATGRTIASYFWDRTGGTAGGSVTLNDARVSKPTFTADLLVAEAQDVRHEFTLTVTDDVGESDTATVMVTVTSPFATPVAHAGQAQRVASGVTVTLDGRASTKDRRRTIASYLWKRTGGSGGAVELSSTSVVQPTFTADTLGSGASDVTHDFSLVVTDSAGVASVAATVTVTVTPNAPPEAHAGTNQTVVSEASVTLDGSGSTAATGRTIASYFWGRTGGTAGGSVELSDARVSKPTFTADLLVAEAQDVRHEFTLTVTDNVGETDTATVMVTVTSPFATPVAHAGEAQKVASGVTVTLDGRASTKDRRRTIASYLWKRTGGSGGAVELSSTSVVQPTFTADTLGSGAADVTHDFSLVVTDSAGVASVAATVTVTVTPNAPPEAHAGTNQTVVSEASVTLDGSGSTAATGRTIASYFWDRTGGTAGGSVELSDARVSKPTFTADLLVAEAQDVRHEFTLTVTDNVGETDTATVMVTVTSPFATPVAHAGEAQKVASGVTVTLDGRASTKDRRRTIASYLWKRTGGSGGSVELSSTSVVQPTFTADTLGSGASDVTHDFSLVVTDSAGVASVAATVTVTVTPNAPPEAHAGTNQTVVSEASVTLDGSGSTAATGRTIASYFWDRTGGTAGGSVELSDARVSKPTFTADLLVAEAQDVRHEFTLTVTDNVGETDTATVMVTVTSPFATPVAHAGEAQKVASGVTVTLDGRASTKDRRRTIASYLWKRTGGSGGSVELSSTSVVQPTFTADTLGSGASDVTHDFSLVVTDSAGVASVAATVTVTVTPNAPPEAHAGTNQTVVSEASVTLDGSGSTAATGRTIASYFWDRTGGTAGGSVELSDARVSKPTFTADLLVAEAQDVRHEFTLTVTDDVGESDTATVMVTVTSPFATPVAHAGQAQRVASGVTVTLDGRASTKDRRRTIASYLWKRTGGSGGSVELSSTSVVQPTFTADTLGSGASDVTHDFSLVVTDSAGVASVAATVTVTVTPNAPPEAHAGTNQTVVSEASVTLDGSGSTAATGRTIASYFWGRTGGTAGGSVTLNDARVSKPTFTADLLVAEAQDVRHEFTLTVTDDVGETDTATVMVTVTSPFATPVAHAGEAQKVASGVTVTLDGRASTKDRRRTIASYLWKRTGGSGGAVELSSTSVVQPTFTADTLGSGAADVTHDFSLVVTDSAGVASVAATVTVTVTPNAPPEAHAGTNQTVVSEASVTLDGSGSTAATGRTIASYFWDRTGGTAGGSVELSDARVSKPTFTADLLVAEAQDVRHEFTLTVTDNVGETDTATVMVTVTSPFATPVAHAGEAQKVASGVTVTLDGRASTKDRRRTIASYLWKRTGGSGGSVELSSTSVVQPTFTADTLGSGASDVTHDFSLVVTDSAGVASVAATVTVTVTPNAPPEAHAGTNQTVVSEASVTLDGSGSTAATGRTIASYFWDRTGGTAGGSVTLNDARVSKPTFTADLLVAEAQDVRHEFTLTVTDNVGETDTATVMVTVTSPFATPVAHAGEAQRVASGVTVTLDGRASTKDRRRTIASYLWKRTGGSGGAVELSSTSVVQPTFTADTLGSGASDVTHDFSLVVTDSAGVASVAATVTVTVTPNAPPDAHAGTNQTVVSEASVTLDGSGSTAATGRTIASYFWDRTGGTAGGSVELSDARVSKPTFTADLLVAEAQDVRHEFTLTVTDNVGETDTATVMVTVTSPFATPVAHAGEAQKVASGVTVTLDGRASTKDRRRTIASYLWKRTGGSGGSVELSSTSVVQPTFTADTLGSGASDVTHDFSLVVTDSAGVASVAATVTVTVTPNAPPEAHAGTNQTVVSEASVTLDGSGSTAATGRTIASYFWDRTGGTAGGSVELSDARVSKPTFTADLLVAEAQDVRHEC